MLSGIRAESEENKMLNVYDFMKDCENRAAQEVRGSRNAREHAVKIARQTVPTRYTKRLKSATAVLRSVCVNLGSYKWKDTRHVLDCVTIAKITEKLVIGTCGERVPLKEVIAWGI